MKAFRFCPALSFRLVSTLAVAVIFATFVTILAPPAAWAQKKLSEDEEIALKKPRDLIKDLWNLPPVGPPMGRLPGITKDGVQLAAAYYPGNVNKETVPVVLLHGIAGNREVFRPLITMLTEQGMAVMAVDLRGHGRSNKQYRYDEVDYRNWQKSMRDLEMAQAQQGSKKNQAGRKARGQTTFQTPSPPTPKLEDLSFEDLQPRDYASMVNDLELVNKYLRVQHERYHVNMNRLILIGMDTGASLAAGWAIHDWADKSSPRNVKVLILIAPAALSLDHDMGNYFDKASKAFKENVNVLIISPSSASTSDANAAKIKSAILNEKEEAADQPGLASRVPIVKIQTDKSGADLFSTKELGVCKTIDDFIKDRFGKYKPGDHKWTRPK